MKHFASFLCVIAAGPCISQTLVDSIPYPGISQGFWGIHVNADTLFLGDDFSGDIYFSDHSGTILGQQPTGFTFDHGLIRRPGSYLIAQDFTTNGAHLYEVDLSGTLMNTWTFPDVIGGHSSGIGDLCADGNAVWYTMYYPDFDVDPYAYAYKWIPGDPTPIDTVPLHGEQPYGIALKGDTLFYVTDNLNGDAERIHAYDLTNEQDLGAVDLPDMATDGDQRPQGMFYDGEFLYLIANRQGGSAFAYQTVFIYAFDASTGFANAPNEEPLTVFPNPATDHVSITSPGTGTYILTDLQGRQVRSGGFANRTTIDVRDLLSGVYLLAMQTELGSTTRRIAVR
ncbi:MAG: T9SS type A sorting domain-containing protein [Flavobacteriales bacterium]